MHLIGRKTVLGDHLFSVVVVHWVKLKFLPYTTQFLGSLFGIVLQHPEDPFVWIQRDMAMLLPVYPVHGSRPPPFKDIHHMVQCTGRGGVLSGAAADLSILTILLNKESRVLEDLSRRRGEQRVIGRDRGPKRLQWLAIRLGRFTVSPMASVPWIFVRRLPLPSVAIGAERRPIKAWGWIADSCSQSIACTVNQIFVTRPLSMTGIVVGALS